MSIGKESGCTVQLINERKSFYNGFCCTVIFRMYRIFMKTVSIILAKRTEKRWELK